MLGGMRKGLDLKAVEAEKHVNQPGVRKGARGRVPYRIKLSVECHLLMTMRALWHFFILKEVGLPTQTMPCSNFWIYIREGLQSVTRFVVEWFRN